MMLQWVSVFLYSCHYVYVFYLLYYKNMKTFKKFLPTMLAVIFGVAFFIGMAHAQGAPGGAWFGLNPGSSWITGLGTENQWTNLITLVKSFINWILGLLSFIALVVLLYGGFNMVTAAGDDAKYKKGFKILQQAAVGLVIVGLSWIIISFIFVLIWGAKNNTVGSITG